MLMRLPPAVVQAVQDLIQAVDNSTPDAFEQLKSRLVGSPSGSKPTPSSIILAWGT
jgi:hypothetical protein